MTTNYHERNHWVGTDAEMALCTPVNPGAVWFQTNTLDSYWWDGASWNAMGGGGGGCFVCDVTNSYGGDGAFISHTTAVDCVAVGYNALTDNTEGNDNVAVGSGALSSNVYGYYNIAIGSGALQANDNDNNTAVGFQALYSNVNGYRNIAVGSNALVSNVDGYDNIGVGINALNHNINGDYNIGIGFNSGFSIESGDANICIGQESLYHNVSGISNVAVGFDCLHNNTVSDNTAIGDQAGKKITTGNKNTFVGSASGNSISQDIDCVNSMALGANSYTTKDNQVVIGDSSVVETLLRGSVLIGTVTDGMTAGGSLAIAQDLAHRGTNIGFFNTAPTTKQTKAGHNNWANISDIVAVLLAYGLVDSA